MSKNPTQMLFAECELIRKELNRSARITSNERRSIREAGYRIAQTEPKEDWISCAEQEARHLANLWDWYTDRCDAEKTALTQAILQAQCVKLYEVLSTLEQVDTEYDQVCEHLQHAISYIQQSMRDGFYG